MLEATAMALVNALTGLKIKADRETAHQRTMRIVFGLACWRAFGPQFAPSKFTKLDARQYED